jgi:hypothetical protein
MSCFYRSSNHGIFQNKKENLPSIKKGPSMFLGEKLQNICKSLPSSKSGPSIIAWLGDSTSCSILFLAGSLKKF